MDSFVYLGVELNYNGSFKKGVYKQVNQARRKLYSMLTKAMRFNLAVDTQLDIFKKLVLPILTYRCEEWGYEDFIIIEVFHRKFLKSQLHVNISTTHCMVYGETRTSEIKLIV